MAEGYIVNLTNVALAIHAGKGDGGLGNFENMHLHLLLAIAERLESLSAKPLAPVLANLAQLVELEAGIDNMTPQARDRLLKAIHSQEAKGGEHP